LLYLLLRQVIDTLPRRETVAISVADQGQVVAICLINPAGLPLLPEGAETGGQEQALLHWLGAEMVIEQGGLRLHMPRRVTG
jgi:hypothetical protein